MTSKAILSKISPETKTEQYFYQVISKMKSIDIDSRGLICGFMNEDTSYPEAASLAASAFEWLEELERNYISFTSKCSPITTTERSAFESYCKKKNWSLHFNEKCGIARENKKFRAKFELDSKRVYLITEKLDELSKMKILNDLGEESCSI